MDFLKKAAESAIQANSNTSSNYDNAQNNVNNNETPYNDAQNKNNVDNTETSNNSNNYNNYNNGNGNNGNGNGGSGEMKTGNAVVDGLLGKVSGAIGQKAEEREDFLDKAIDVFQDKVLKQDQSNESASEQATDRMVAQGIKTGYKQFTGKDFPTM
ncbi:hypothetical protein DFP72DRAFT_933123 [Ephemerocybe angulata]|uniref:Uncharacterized protein n=1 Tax=Ephemerocybe angulata TaxID=980116 RepID=A0A8H6LUR8_9AGAR|nr:hypothetical protein DFP72DRAFT_933123 [Tulosesus angulatus]